MSSAAGAARAVRKRTVRDVEVAGRRVLVRADLNVPLQDGRVADDGRIRAVLPTLRYLLERGCRVVLCSHLGRPDPALSLRPVAQRLQELLGVPVRFVEEPVGPRAEEARAALASGQVLLLENLRFHPGEERNDPEFARALAGDAELFVQDAFGVLHRAHASTVGVTRYLPAVAGLLLARELEVLEELRENPRRPFWAVVGGAKVSDKLGVLRRLVQRCDGLCVGGAMAHTFLLAQGYPVGRSLCEPDRVEDARAVLEEAQSRGVPVLLPRDLVVAEPGSPEPRVVPAEAVPPEAVAMDVGPATVDAFARALAGAATVFWNGPVGVFEQPPFHRGTLALARALAESGAAVVVGGGDSAAAVRQAGVEERMYHVSTGGGASLEFLEGRLLPGLACLPDAG